MSATAIKNNELTAFAEKVYTEQKDQFVQDFSDFLKKRIDSGMAQFENGEHMSFEDFEAKFRKEYLK